jgi:hypothetical protein
MNIHDRTVPLTLTASRREAGCDRGEGLTSDCRLCPRSVRLVRQIISARRRSSALPGRENQRSAADFADRYTRMKKKHKLIRDY